LAQYLYVYITLETEHGGVRFLGRKGKMPAWFSTELDNYTFRRRPDEVVICNAF